MSIYTTKNLNFVSRNFKTSPLQVYEAAPFVIWRDELDNLLDSKDIHLSNAVEWDADAEQGRVAGLYEQVSQLSMIIDVMKASQDYATVEDDYVRHRKEEFINRYGGVDEINKFEEELKELKKDQYAAKKAFTNRSHSLAEVWDWLKETTASQIYEVALMGAKKYNEDLEKFGLIIIRDNQFRETHETDGTLKDRIDVIPEFDGRYFRSSNTRSHCFIHNNRYVIDSTRKTPSGDKTGALKKGVEAITRLLQLAPQVTVGRTADEAKARIGFMHTVYDVYATFQEANRSRNQILSILRSDPSVSFAMGNFEMELVTKIKDNLCANAHYSMLAINAKIFKALNPEEGLTVNPINWDHLVQDITKLYSQEVISGDKGKLSINGGNNQLPLSTSAQEAIMTPSTSAAFNAFQQKYSRNGMNYGLCWSFSETGRCNYGNSCRFRHVRENNKRGRSPTRRPRSPNKNSNRSNSQPRDRSTDRERSASNERNNKKRDLFKNTGRDEDSSRSRSTSRESMKSKTNGNALKK